MRRLFGTLLVLLAIAQVVAVAIAFQKPAYAYADPGSGLLFLQVAGSMVAGALFIVRSKLRRLFHRGRNPVESQSPSMVKKSSNNLEADVGALHPP
jgi:ribosomal protein L24E